MYNTTVQDGPDTTDPHTIDWAQRQARALIPFKLDEAGLPVNPREPDLPAGRGDLWHWGEAVAADAIVTAIDQAGARRVLMVERADGHGWALPGGMLDPGETHEAAAGRELAEETGLDLSPALFVSRPRRYVPDPRAGRGAWVVTVPSVAVLHTDTPPAVDGRDDAARAEWLPAGTYAELAAAVAEAGGRIFGAHVDLLRFELSPTASV
ncbi:MAG: NUDIX domain-containing protein [Nocardiopsaceae bacterium]|nr:NUDIX domain-containing protein [Nocardiopsaceae bacterium]